MAVVGGCTVERLLGELRRIGARITLPVIRSMSATYGSVHGSDACHPTAVKDHQPLPRKGYLNTNVHELAYIELG